MSTVLKDQQAETRNINIPKWRKGGVVEYQHHDNNDHHETKMKDIRYETQNDDNNTTNIQDEYQKLCNEIQEIETKVEQLTIEYHQKKAKVIEDMGEAVFYMVCPDIDLEPSKYIENQGKQIKALAQLGVNKQSLNDQLNNKKQELDVLQKRINELNASSPLLIKELRLVQKSNDQLSKQKKELTVNVDTIWNVIEQYKQKIKIVEIVEEFRKKIQSYKEGILLLI